MSEENKDKAPDVAPAPADDVAPTVDDVSGEVGPPAEAVKNVVGDPAPADPAEGEVVTEAEKSKVTAISDMQAKSETPIHPGLRGVGAPPYTGVAEDEDIPLGAGVSPDWLNHVAQPDAS